MHPKANRITALILLFAVVITFACCGTKEEPTSYSDYTYVTVESTAAPSETAAQNVGFGVDPSWKANFSAEYKYFNRASSEEAVTIREYRAPDTFAAIYPETGNLVYYTENGGSVDCYTVVPSEKHYVHSVLEGKKLSDLSSTFMKLTAVDADLPELANVLYMQDETVAGRACKKYIQRAYENGKVTETVYVWVDAVLGFALKCEDYNAEDELQVSWETLSFTEGGVTSADMGVNLSDYTFTEGE